MRNTLRATVARPRWPRKHGMTKRWKLIRRRWRNTLANALRSLTGLKQTGRSKLRRIKTSRTPITRSSSTIRPTPTTNYRCPLRRNSRTCMSQVSCKNRASFFLSAVARLRLVTLLFVSFKLFLRIINGRQTRQNLLQPPGLLERRLCNQKISRGGESA